MFKRGSVVMTIWNLVVAAGLIALGIATCVNNDNQDFRNVMIMIAGIFVIIDAGLRILTQVIQVVRFQHGVMVRTDLASAATGASELAIGILLIMISQNSANMIIVLQYLILFVSILLITLGGVALLFAIVFMVKKVGQTVANILSIVCGIILVTGGILILVYANQEALLQLFFIFFGILLILVGLALLMGTIVFIAQARAAAKLAKSVAKEAKESPNANVIDGDVTEEKPQDEPAPAAEESKADEPKNEENPANPEAE